MWQLRGPTTWLLVESAKCRPDLDADADADVEEGEEEEERRRRRRRREAQKLLEEESTVS